MEKWAVCIYFLLVSVISSWYRFFIFLLPLSSLSGGSEVIFFVELSLHEIHELPIVTVNILILWRDFLFFLLPLQDGVALLIIRVGEESIFLAFVTSSACCKNYRGGLRYWGLNPWLGIIWFERGGEFLTSDSSLTNLFERFFINLFISSCLCSRDSLSWFEVESSSPFFLLASCFVFSLNLPVESKFSCTSNASV